MGLLAIGLQTLVIAKADVVTLAQGQFQDAPTHKTMGEVVIYKGKHGAKLMFSDSFLTDEGPDLHVVLRDSQNTQDMIILERLTSFEGTQEYDLNISLSDLNQYDEVIIYCKRFGVLFGSALLN